MGSGYDPGEVPGCCVVSWRGEGQPSLVAVVESSIVVKSGHSQV